MDKNKKSPNKQQSPNQIIKNESGKITPPTKSAKKKEQQEVISVSSAEADEIYDVTKTIEGKFHTFDNFFKNFGFDNKSSSSIEKELLLRFFSRYSKENIKTEIIKEPEVIVTINKLFLLRPDRWIASCLIDAFFHVLNILEKEKNVDTKHQTFFVNSAFFDNINHRFEEKLYNVRGDERSMYQNTVNEILDEVNNKNYGNKTYDQLKIKMPGHHNAILNYKYIVFPNYVPEHHFGLIAVETHVTPPTGLNSSPHHRYEIRNYDSLVTYKQSDSSKLKKRIATAKLTLIESFLQRIYNEHLNEFTISFTIEDMGLLTEQQRNGVDCGIFVCMKGFDYFNKLTDDITCQNNAAEFRKKVFCVIISKVMDTDLSEEITNNMDIDTNDLINFEKQDVTIFENFCNDDIIDIATGGKLENNSGVSRITQAVYTFVSIELLISSLQDIATNNICNLICRELCEQLDKKASEIDIWQFLKDSMINIMAEIDRAFNTMKLELLLKSASSSDENKFTSINNFQFLEAENSTLIKATPSMLMIKATPAVNINDNNKLNNDFPEKYYDNTGVFLDDYKESYLNHKNNPPKTSPTNKKLAKKKVLKKDIISLRKKELQRKIYRIIMRIFEGIGFEYLINENEFSNEKDGLIKYKEKLNEFSGLKTLKNNYFREFVMKAYQSVFAHVNKELIYKMIFATIKTKSSYNQSIEFLTKSKTLEEEAKLLNISKEQAAQNVTDVLFDKKVLRASKKPEGFFKNSTIPSPTKFKRSKKEKEDVKEGSLTSVVTALLNLKQSPEKTLSGVTNNTSTTSNKKSSETTNNGVTNNASTTSNNNKTPKNKASKKHIVTSNLTTTSSTTLEDELLFEYGGIECIDSMGVMIDLTANNDGLAEEKLKFKGLLDNFNAGGFSYESLKNLIKEIRSLKIFKLFIQKPGDDNNFTTRGDGFCLLRMGHQLNFKHKKFKKYINFDDWRQMDPDINKIDGSQPLLELIETSVVHMTQLVEEGEIPNYKLNDFTMKLKPVIEMLKSKSRTKYLNSKQYLDDGDLHSFITDKNITYAIYQSLYKFEHIREIDVGYNEFNTITSKLNQDEWLRMSFAKHKGEELETEYCGCSYDDIASVATCGNNIYYYSNNHFCWAGDFVDDPYALTDAPILAIYNTCVAILLYKILIRYSNLIESNINPEGIYDILDKEIIVEAVVMSALEDLMLEKSEETNATEMKNFVDQLKNAQKENESLKQKIQIDEQKREEDEKRKMERKTMRQKLQKEVEDEIKSLKEELTKKEEINTAINEELNKVKQENDALKSEKNLSKSPGTPGKRRGGK